MGTGSGALLWRIRPMNFEMEKLITKALQQRDKKIEGVSVAQFETQNDDIFCIPRNRSQTLVAFIPKAVLGLERPALISALANTRIRYERA